MKGKQQFLEEHKDKRQQCEIWSRVMGYMRNVNSFNVGKKSEFKERNFFKIKVNKRND